jgi:hypothetical protein
VIHSNRLRGVGEVARELAVYISPLSAREGAFLFFGQNGLVSFVPRLERES